MLPSQSECTADINNIENLNIFTLNVCDLQNNIYYAEPYHLLCLGFETLLSLPSACSCCLLLVAG